ncbi:hypothetical protein DV735_g1422, partial [Chaetothyriales sp. CBS 134920]
MEKEKERHYCDTKIFIFNIPYTVSPERLVDFFADVGLEVSLSDIAICQDKEGNSKGYAFVEMHDAATAASAIEALEGSLLDGRVLGVRRAFHSLRHRPSHSKAWMSRPESAQQAMSKKQTTTPKLGDPFVEEDIAGEKENDESDTSNKSHDGAKRTRKRNKKGNKRSNKGNKSDEVDNTTQGDNKTDGDNKKLTEMWVSVGNGPWKFLTYVQPPEVT